MALQQNDCLFYAFWRICPRRDVDLVKSFVKNYSLPVLTQLSLILSAVVVLCAPFH